MKKVTKVISVICVFALLFALAACGNDEATSITPPEPTGEGVINSNLETTVPTDTTEPTATGCPVCAEREEREELDNDAGGDVAEEPEWKDEFDEIIAPNGNRFKVPGSLGYGFIVETHNDRCLMAIGRTRELWLCTQESGFTKLSGEQLVINWTVAYDTIYWFNLDKEVWAVDWWTNAEPYLFCEDAIGVSPHADEGEGAVVEWERANNTWYGIPIYSPV